MKFLVITMLLSFSLTALAAKAVIKSDTDSGCTEQSRCTDEAD